MFKKAASESSLSSRSTTSTAPTPSTTEDLINLYFLDSRSKLIEIAAFLDRIERARATSTKSDKTAVEDDFRLTAFKRALAVVAGNEKNKAKAVQMVFSDPTDAPLESAAGLKGAMGAWGGRPRG